ncbi:MAG: hypothetical protein H5T94_06630 [Pseudothermotoga sp.]|nr:hypothetical protein [Pseudothermotoga sp.]
MGDALFNEHLVRERAQGRVTILRQRLELAVLLEFKAKYGDKWVLVDGSLFLIDKWRSRMSRIFGTRLGTDSEAQFEENLLKKVVGVIRTHRLRFEKIQKVLHLKYHQRSTVFRLFEEVDIKGRKWMLEEKGMYSEPHFTWYTRFRTTCPISQGMAGLVRIDVHRATLGFSRDEEINPHTFEKSRNTVDEITRSVLAEQFPAQHRRIGYDNTPQVYPVRELEKMLRATILPVRTMRNLFNTVLG